MNHIIRFYLGTYKFFRSRKICVIIKYSNFRQYSFGKNVDESVKKSLEGLFGESYEKIVESSHLTTKQLLEHYNILPQKTVTDSGTGHFKVSITI